jgi:hypothetical protein
MIKISLTVFLLTVAMAGIPASAQSGSSEGDGSERTPTPGRLLNQDYLTPTGETVPRPGVPQASGPTPLDRQIRNLDDHVEHSICSNC